MLTQTEKQTPIESLENCVKGLSEEEIGIAIAYMLTKINKKEQQTQTTLTISNPSIRLFEMMVWIDIMNDSSRKKLSLFLMNKLVPKPPKMNIGRRKGRSR